MSAGPIKREREAYLPAIVTTTAAARVCLRTGSRGYCGRRKGQMAPFLDAVTCSECRAALVADGWIIPEPEVSGPTS